MHKNLEELFNEIMHDLEKRIKRLGLSKRGFCHFADIHENTLYNLKNPRISTLAKIESKLVELEHAAKKTI